jgi:hypothetical protein
MKDFLHNLLQLRVQDVRFATGILPEDLFQFHPNRIANSLGVTLHSILLRYVDYSIPNLYRV